MVDKTRFIVNWRKSYAFVIIGGSLLVTILFVLVYNAFHFSSTLLTYVVTTGIVSTILVWLGSGFISMVLMTRIDIFVKPVKLISLLTISLISYTTLIVLIELTMIESIQHVTISHSMKVSTIVISVLITLFITAVHTSFYFFQSWKSNMLKAERLEKENLLAQYETLKTQVNPHFVFNSLNTLLTMVEGNSEAVKYVESLSEFLRYVLQKRDKEVVMLRDEIAITNQYLVIQKGRFGEKLRAFMNVPEHYYHYAVPPLALQMLVENAIKHNVISKDQPLDIRVYVEDNTYLVVENNINPKQEVEPSTGLGLNNIKNRYLFLSSKEVLISWDNGMFKVGLPLVEFVL